jgi:hypothetical protein
VQAKLKEAEIKVHEAVRNEKVLETRLKLQNESKEKLERSLTEKFKATLKEKEDQVAALEERIRAQQVSAKQREDDAYKKSAEFEKLIALIEQKLQLTEKELSEYKTRYTTKDQDYKDINKELYQARKEAQTL